MFRPRVIPCLLLKGAGLVKTTRFADPVYIGDPLNAVRIFNMRLADEMIFLDIKASHEGRCISAELVKRIGEECFMPFAVGGGIRTPDQIRELFRAGAEKVVLNTGAVECPDCISEAAEIFGSQSIVVCIDVKENNGEKKVTVRSGQLTDLDPVSFARNMEKHGAGEIMINSIDREGTMSGYDIELVKAVADAVSIPVIASGGAGTLEHMREALHDGNASAVSAGSMFVFQGPRRGVLISFPEQAELMDLSPLCEADLNGG